METNRLRYFVTVAETESVRRSAELLHISPSALSKSLQLLQDELGVQLLVPLGRGITITPQGRRFATQAKQLLEQIERLEDAIRTDQENEKDEPLKIASFEVFSTYFLQTLDTVGWQDRKLVLHECLPGELERAVEQNAADFGITYMPTPYANIEHLKVGQIEMGVYRRRGTFAGQKQQDLPFVVPVIPLQGAATRLRGLDGWPDDAYRRKVRFEVTLMESALELCRQGRCAGYFPTFIVREHNRKYREEFHLERHPSPYSNRVCYSDVYLVKRKDRPENADSKLVSRLIRQGCR